jgi:hypothetical protein
MLISKRLRYFLGHLGCSILLGLLLLALVFLVWYPAPFAHAVGVTHIFLMLLAIDVTVGPLFSLLVYKEGKKTLKMDLAIIILLQVIALGYGVYALAQSRPAWVVQAGWLFEAVPANSIDSKDQQQAKAEYQRNSLFGPQWVAVDSAKNPQNVLAAAQLMPSTYTTVESQSARIQQHAQTLEALQAFNAPNDIAVVLKQYPQAKKWMPLRTTGVGLVVLLNDKNQVLATVDLRPWQE